MNEKKEYAVLKFNETVSQSVYKDIVTGAMVAFCVYISQGSTWWTFITGLMFLVFMFGKLATIFKTSRNQFRTKAELQEWVDSLPDS